MPDYDYSPEELKRRVLCRECELNPCEEGKELCEDCRLEEEREKTMTGKCVKCGKDVKLGTDGSCKNCNVEICWECWVEAGHECSNCGDFDGKRDPANATLHLPTEAKLKEMP